MLSHGDESRCFGRRDRRFHPAIRQQTRHRVHPGIPVAQAKRFLDILGITGYNDRRVGERQSLFGFESSTKQNVLSFLPRAAWSYGIASLFYWET